MCMCLYFLLTIFDLFIIFRTDNMWNQVNDCERFVKFLPRSYK